MAARKPTQEKTSETETAPAPTFTRKAQITFPVLKKADDIPIYVKITEPIFTGKEMQTKKGEDEMKAAQIARVVDLETGLVMEMICNAVLESTLNESFPEQKYVGKCFEITQHAKKEGKRYRTYSVWEIDCNAE